MKSAPGEGSGMKVSGNDGGNFDVPLLCGQYSGRCDHGWAAGRLPPLSSSHHAAAGRSPRSAPASAIPRAAISAAATGLLAAALSATADVSANLSTAPAVAAARFWAAGIFTARLFGARPDLSAAAAISTTELSAVSAADLPATVWLSTATGVSPATSTRGSAAT